MGRVSGVVVGVAFILLGFFAIVEPVVAGLAAAILIGWLLLISGAAHIAAAFFVDRGGASRGWTAVLGVLYVACGLFFITHPLMGLGTLTLFLAAVLIAEAAVVMLVYVRLRRGGASPWMLANAAVTLFVGLMIWMRWPASAVWAVGTMMGVNLLMTGLFRIMPSVRPVGRRAF